MDLSKVTAGRNPPKDIHVFIEIPVGSVPVKYELDKESGALYVDRFLHTSMFYPGNYGFIPHTLSGDSDPCDVLVLAPVPVVPGAVVRCRPVGALLMEDQAGPDEKIIAVPVDDLHPFYKGLNSYLDLPEILRDQIGHFFAHYKDLEKGKWSDIRKWIDTEGSKRLIMKGIERASVDELLRAAIGQKRIIQFQYQNKKRVVEPHDYGIQNGSAKLLAYQIGGSSSGTLPNWRLMEVESISDVHLLDRSFAGGRPPASGNHKRWDQIFIRVE